MAIESEQKNGMTAEKHFWRNAVRTILALFDRDVKVAVHRLRAEFRDAITAEVAQTVASPDEIEDEIRHLFRAVELK